MNLGNYHITQGARTTSHPMLYWETYAACRSVVAVILLFVGEWLSLVEHLVRDQGVGGSNPLSPTISS
jgi:hypothetical protein